MKKNFYLLFSFILCFLEPASSRGLQQVVDLTGYWKFNIGDDSSWIETEFDHSDWRDIVVPAAWENEGFHGYDGYGWYRKEFTIEHNEKQAYYLELGYIDDADEVYLNGKLIGFTGSFPPNFRTAYESFRRYYLPGKFLKDGKNVLAVRVYDTVLDGGIVKGEPGIYIDIEKPPSAYMLEGIWKFKMGSHDVFKEPEYSDDTWDTVMVPHWWKSYKKIHLHEFATYRKTFTLPRFLQNEKELVLVLGKIDDFDRVYLNGVLIGYTKDDLPLGRSTSWMKHRVYALFESSLNRNGENTLTVEVEDIGINAGIYEGPIAVTTSEDFKKLIEGS